MAARQQIGDKQPQFFGRSARTIDFVSDPGQIMPPSER
jgi:hypothetical protein